MIDDLNEHIPLELAAHLRYAAHAKLIEFHGYKTLATKYAEEADEELEHAKKLQWRVMQLGGMPASTPDSPKPLAKWDIEELLLTDLAFEKQVLESLKGIACEADEEAEDWETFRVAQELIKDTEDHVTWLSTHLALIAEIGKQNWLQAQL